jgi:hypothetical protein
VQALRKDDGFVGVLNKDIPNKLALMELRPGLSSGFLKSGAVAEFTPEAENHCLPEIP